MNKVSGIYKIQSLSKPERVYIGSAVCIPERWKYHLKDLRNGKHGNGRLQNHFNKYGKNDLIFSILIGCDKEDLLVTEQFFIDSYKPYFNICKIAGSPLGVKRSPETCQRMSIARKGKTTAWKGGHLSEENRRKLSIAHKGIQAGEKNPMFGVCRKGLGKGRVFSEEHKKKLSEAMKGRPAWCKGKKMSEEQKEKMRNYVKTPEHCRKISEAKKGGKGSPGKRSEQVKENMRLGWVKRKLKKVA